MSLTGINSDPSFEFYRGEKLMAAMNWEYETTQLTPQSIHRVSKWLAEHGYDELYKREKAEAAQEKRDLEQHAAIVRCYPERVRKVFDELVKASDDGDEDDRDADDAQDFSDKAAKIAKAVGDPVKLAVMTFRGMGAIVDSESLARGHDDRILIVQAGRTVGDEDFFKALEAIRGDRQAELGAARLYFEEGGYRDKTGPKHREWMIRLASLLLNHDEDDVIRDVLFGDDGSGEQRTDATLRAIESLGGLRGAGCLGGCRAGRQQRTRRPAKIAAVATEDHRPTLVRSGEAAGVGSVYRESKKVVARALGPSSSHTAVGSDRVRGRSTRSQRRRRRGRDVAVGSGSGISTVSAANR